MLNQELIKLLQNGNLQIINLANQQVTLEQFQTILQLANQLPANQLTELVLWGHRIQDNALISEVIQLIAKQRETLQVLDLGSNAAGKQGSALIEALVNSTQLKYLSLWDTELQDSHITALATALANNQVLQNLQLGSNPIGDEALAALMQIVTKPQLEKLGLHTTKLSDQALAQLVSVLPNTLKELNLSHSQMGGLTVKALLNRFKQGDLANLTMLQVPEQEMTTGLREQLKKRLLRGKLKLYVNDIPERFICPRTRKIMFDPVTTASRLSYEREALKDSKEGIPNDDLKAEILNFLAKHPKHWDSIYVPQIFIEPLSEVQTKQKIAPLKSVVPTELKRIENDLKDLLEGAAEGILIQAYHQATKDLLDYLLHKLNYTFIAQTLEKNEQTELVLFMLEQCGLEAIDLLRPVLNWPQHEYDELLREYYQHNYWKQLQTRLTAAKIEPMVSSGLKINELHLTIEAQAKRIQELENLLAKRQIELNEAPSCPNSDLPTATNEAPKAKSQVLNGAGNDVPEQIAQQELGDNLSPRTSSTGYLTSSGFFTNSDSTFASLSDVEVSQSLSKVLSL